MSNAFIEILAEMAQPLAKDRGLFASVMIAQAFLESDEGKSTLSQSPNYNLFGVKGEYQGLSVKMPTTEYKDGKSYHVIAEFRSYPSYKESLNDYANLLRNGVTWNPKIYEGTWLENAHTYQDATKALSGTYATDPNYAEKVNQIIEQYSLTEYDTVKPVEQSKPKPPEKPKQTPENVDTYTIKKGDTLTKIAKLYHTTIDRLLHLNPHIENADKIYAGQDIIVAGDAYENYTIKANDNLTNIANEYHTTVNELMCLNPQIKNADIIFVGKEIKVPKK
jgi:LysM repeat protein